MTIDIKNPGAKAASLSAGLLKASQGKFFQPARIVAVIGDSRADLSWLAANGGGRSTYCVSPFAWLEFLTGGTVTIPGALNFGVAGETTTQILARTDTAVAAAVAAGAGAAIGFMSTNDRTSGLSLATTKANATAIEAKFTDAGLAFIWVAETPRGDAAHTGLRLTGTQLANHVEIRRWLIERAYYYQNVYTVDPWAVIADRASTTGDAIANYLYDGLHIGSRGAFAIAVQLKAIIDRIFTPIARSFASAADIGSASNPYGNAMSNAQFAGSGGTAGSNVTGTVPTSWTVGTPVAGLSVVSSIIAGTGSAKLQLAITGTPSIAYSKWDALKQAVFAPTNGIAAGQTYRGFFPVEWDDPTGLNHISPYIKDDSNVRRALYNNGGASDPFLWPTGAQSGVIVTDPLTMGGAATFLEAGVHIQVGPASAATITVRFGEPMIARVAPAP